MSTLTPEQRNKYARKYAQNRREAWERGDPRRCSKCKETLVHTEFSPTDIWCKSCRRAYEAYKRALVAATAECSQCGLTWEGGNAVRWYGEHHKTCIGTPRPSMDDMYQWLDVEVVNEHGCLVPRQNIKGKIAATKYNKIVGAGSRLIGEAWAHRAILVVVDRAVGADLTASHTCSEGFGLKGCVNADHLTAETLEMNLKRIPIEVREAATKVANDAVRAMVRDDPEGFRKRYRDRTRKAGLTTSSMRRTCDDCGLTAWPGAMGRHLKSSGHSGYTQL